MADGLRLAMSEIFNAVNGDRLDVPNVIFLITHELFVSDDGSADELDDLDDKVRHFQNLGVRIVVVGINISVSECSIRPFLGDRL